MRVADITDPAVYAAALRFERETGKSIEHELPGASEAEIELVLIVRRFPPDRKGKTAALAGTSGGSAPRR